MINIYKYVSIFFHRASKAYSRHITLLGSKPLRETFPDKIKEWMGKKQLCEIYSTGWEKVFFFMPMKYILLFRALQVVDVLHGLLWFTAKSHFHGLPLCSPFDTYFLQKLLINEGKPQTVILGRYFVEGSTLNISWGPMCSLFLPIDENFEGKSCIFRSKYLKLEYFRRTDVFFLACHFE